VNRIVGSVVRYRPEDGSGVVRVLGGKAYHGKTHFRFRFNKGLAPSEVVKRNVSFLVPEPDSRTAIDVKFLPKTSGSRSPKPRNRGNQARSRTAHARRKAKKEGIRARRLALAGALLGAVAFGAVFAWDWFGESTMDPGSAPTTASPDIEPNEVMREVEEPATSHSDQVELGASGYPSAASETDVEAKVSEVESPTDASPSTATPDLNAADSGDSRDSYGERIESEFGSDSRTDSEGGALSGLRPQATPDRDAMTDLDATEESVPTASARPSSGPNSGCSVGVAVGDVCVYMRPMPGPMGRPIPMRVVVPRVPPPSEPPNEADERESSSDLFDVSEDMTSEPKQTDVRESLEDLFDTPAVDDQEADVPETGASRSWADLLNSLN